jgi:hypothetical protein
MKSKPPHWFLEALKITQNHHRDDQGDLHVNFDDDFAPSYSIADTDNPEVFNKRTRPLFYNDHVDDSLEVAISKASHLGLPRIPFFFPLQFTHITESDFAECMSKAGDISEMLDEGSPEWLAVVCYINWAQACFTHSDGGSTSLVADLMVRAGATARELELALLNREHAVRGRKTIRAASEGGKQRRRKFSPDTQKVLNEMQRLIGDGHSVARAADLARSKGMGQSKTANQRLWYRHKGKPKKF